MTIRIAHLSDLHFGQQFDIDLWSTVKTRIVDSGATLLLVSGDLVDEPSPALLLAAKVELTALAERLRAPLHVVPGNHDIYPSGLNLPWFVRKDWFERIFYDAETAEAEEALRQQVGGDIGFSRGFLHAVRVESGASRTFRRLGLGNSFTRCLGPVRPKPSVVQAPGHRVLLALFDSNAPAKLGGLASGGVAQADLLRIGEQMGQDQEAHLVRIALIHHHVLPIAFTHSDDVFKGAEQFMVLRNAGNVLSLLADHHFDLVLHGHHHRPQFARLDLMPDTAPGYPIAVVSAGSACLKVKDDHGNCLNLIEVDSRGRITVESVYSGASKSPGWRSDKTHIRTFLEPLSAVKSRAMMRASERQFLRIQSRKQSWVLTESGDLVISDRVCAERIRTTVPGAIEIGHAASVPRDGRFVEAHWTLDDQSRKQRFEIIDKAPDAPGHNGREPTIRRFDVSVPPDARQPFEYEISYACANSVKMTRWEAEQRRASADAGQARPADWDMEWVGATVSHPTEKLVLELALPESLAGLVPFLRCWRFNELPVPTPDWLGAGRPLDQFTIDPDMADEETAGLRYDPEVRVWRLTLAQPLVGYRYQLVWQTPDVRVDGTVRGEVLHQRDLLLESAWRRASGEPMAADEQALAIFGTLCDAIEKLLAQGGAHEQKSVEIYAYDKTELALCPVFSRQSWTDRTVPFSVSIPLGCGIAGAAFQQCRTIPWAEADARSPLIEPVFFPPDPEALPLRTILAMPMFHPSQANEPHPPPWAATCVVSFGSSSHAARTAGLCRPDPDAACAAALTHARAIAHAHVRAILAILDGAKTKAGR